jgi:hypothetical protein
MIDRFRLNGSSVQILLAVSPIVASQISVANAKIKRDEASGDHSSLHARVSEEWYILDHLNVVYFFCNFEIFHFFSGETPT